MFSRLFVLAAVVFTSTLTFAVDSANQKKLDYNDVMVASLILHNQTAIAKVLKTNKINGPVDLICVNDDCGRVTTTIINDHTLIEYSVYVTQCEPSLPMPCDALGTLTIGTKTGSASSEPNTVSFKRK